MFLLEINLTIARGVVKISEEIDRTPAQLALNWVRQQKEKGVIIPIIGGRNEAQIKDNLGCLNSVLTSEQLQQLDEISRIELGFPHDFLAEEMVQSLV